MDKKLKPCPFCGGTAEAKWMSGPGWLVKCKKCSARTIGGTNLENDEHAARAAWNRRAQPANEPLTLDEIRGMDGEPVWIAEANIWAIVKCEQKGRWAGIPFAVGYWQRINIEWNIKQRRLMCYRIKIGS
ncbi:MAG: Lar family restriction alleviation protein [Oscillospiraceae bacterium]|jgi:Lar family restriction alleviation protein|nr:Lar family restriction alleviation protein [Oscillospiraceae bacterium]